MPFECLANRIDDMVHGGKKTIHKCSKHPLKEATELCVRCSTSICSDCRLKEKKQAFCSSWCYRLHLLTEFRLSSLNPIPHIYKLKNYDPALDAFAMMVVLMLIAAIHFAPANIPENNIIVTNTVDQVSAKTPASKISTQVQVAPLLKPVKQQEPALAEKIIVKQKKQLPQKRTISNKIIKTSSISKVKAAGKKISITFDGGSNDSSAREILDVLKGKRVNTTFFLTASFIRSYPDIVRRMVAEGHEIGNHTFNHPHLTTYDINRIHMTLPEVNLDFIKRELDSTNKIFTKVTGKQMAPYWRAPYGEINKDILRWAAKAGYQHISWTVDRKTRESMDSLDWVADQSSTLYLSSKEIKDRLLAFADGNERARGGIVLMHLGSERKVDMVHNRLEDIIDSFLAKGYEIVPISTLLKAVKKS